jgi:ribosome-associated protein
MAPKKPAKKIAKKAPAKKAAPKTAPKAKKPAPKPVLALKAGKANKLRDSMVAALEDAKAQDIIVIDVSELSSITDFMVIASGSSSRQVAGIADKARRALIDNGMKQVRVEGLPQGDWAVVDGGDVIIHIFRPEVRQYYRLEEVWGMEPPLQETFKNL